MCISRRPHHQRKHRLWFIRRIILKGFIYRLLMKKFRQHKLNHRQIIYRPNRWALPDLNSVSNTVFVANATKRRRFCLWWVIKQLLWLTLALFYTKYQPFCYKNHFVSLKFVKFTFSMVSGAWQSVSSTAAGWWNQRRLSVFTAEAIKTLAKFKCSPQLETECSAHIGE